MPLTTTEQALLRAFLYEVRKDAAVNYTKPTLTASFQAIDDWFEANRAAISAVIDTASAPVLFSGANKKRLVAAWLAWKLTKERD